MIMQGEAIVLSAKDIFNTTILKKDIDKVLRDDGATDTDLEAFYKIVPVQQGRVSLSIALQNLASKACFD